MSIFLVHSSKDAQAVVHWETFLNDAGITTFLAERNLGSRVPEVIAKALEQCKICLLFLTPDFLDCGWCRDETTYARNMGREMFAIVLKDTRVRGFSGLTLSGTNIFDIDDTDLEEKLLYEIKLSLGLPVTGKRPVLIHSKKLRWGEEEKKEEVDGDGNHDEEVDGKGDARQSLKRKRSKEVGDDGDGKKNKKEKK